MAISKTFATGYQVIINVKENSQNVASNTTNVTVTVQLKSLGSSWAINSSATKNGTLTINGTSYAFTFSAALKGSQTKTIFAKTVNIAHNNDGTKSLNVSAHLDVEITISGSYQDTWTLSDSQSLTTIARASTLAAISNFTANNSFSVTVTKKNTAYYDTLTIKLGSKTIKTIAGISNGATSITFSTSELNAIYDALPSATKGTLTFTLATKTSSSGSAVGSASRTATVTIPSTVKPSISGVTLAETVSGIAAKFGAYIQSVSKLKGTISATAGRGSSVVTYKTVINGTTYSESDNVFNTGVLKTSGSNNYTVTVTDKRGRTATHSGTFNVLAYSKPTISSITVKRAVLDGTTYTANDEGTHAIVTVKADVTALSNKNDKTFTLGYRAADSTGSFTNVELTQTSYALNQTVYVANMDKDTEYEFKLTVADYFYTDNNAIVKSRNLSSTFSLINFHSSGKGLAFGGVCDDNNAFQIKLPRTELSAISYIGGNKSDNTEKNLYFTSKDDAAYPHNCKLYGGNGTSATSIGMWDSARSEQIFRYQTGDQTLHFGANLSLLQGGKPLLIEVLNTIDTNVGQYQLSNGLLLQWGKLSVTPAAVNVAEKVTITFKKAYATKPNVFAIPQTSAPQNMSVSVGQGSTTVTAFDIYLTRNSASATSIQWFAVGEI